MYSDIDEIFNENYYRSVYNISAHGNSDGREFVVPPGYNFIQLQDFGFELSDIISKNISNFLMKDENIPYLNYLINWRTPEACRINDFEDNRLLLKEMNKRGIPIKPFPYRSPDYNNPFRYLKHYPPGSIIKNHQFDFTNTWKPDNLSITSYFEVNKSVIYSSSGIIPIKNNNYNGETHIFSNRTELDEIMFKDSILKARYFIEKEYKSSLIDLLNIDNDSEPIVPPGTYFIMSCRSCTELDNPTDTIRWISQLRQQSNQKTKNWCQKIHPGKEIVNSVQEYELNISGESKSQDANHDTLEKLKKLGDELEVAYISKEGESKEGESKQNKYHIINNNFSKKYYINY